MPGPSLTPRSFKGEASRIISFTWPTVLGQFLEQLTFTIILSFSGHLGEHEIAATSLAIAFCNITGYYPIIGLCTVIDTLGSHTVGMGDLKSLKILMYRCYILTLILICPISIIWYFTEDILIFIEQNPRVARSASSFAWRLVVTLPAYTVYLIAVKTLYVKGLPKTVVILSLLSIIDLTVLCYLFVVELNWGFSGIAWANVINTFLGATFAVSILHFSKLINFFEALDFSLLCQDLIPFGKVAIYGILMFCLECWCFEVGLFIVGTAGEVQLAAQGVLQQMNEVIFMVSQSVATAAAVRVGTALGAGQPRNASMTANVSLILIIISNTFIALVMLLLRNHLGYLYVSAANIASVVSGVIPLLAICQIADGLQGVCSGVLLGCGKQRHGAIVNFFSYYAMALPLSVTLFRHGWGVLGFWMGILSGVLLQSACFLIILYNTSWSSESHSAYSRVESLSRKLPTSQNHTKKEQISQR